MLPPTTRRGVPLAFFCASLRIPATSAAVTSCGMNGSYRGIGCGRRRPLERVLRHRLLLDR
jgi:hypothetical protein